MKKYIPHILGAIFVLVIIGAWMLIAHLVKKPSETQVPFVAEDLPREGAPEMPKHEVQVHVLVVDGQAPVFTKVVR